MILSNDIMSVKVLAVIEEKLFSLLDLLVGVDADPVVAVHNEDLDGAVGLGAMISEANLATHPYKRNRNKEK